MPEGARRLISWGTILSLALLAAVIAGELRLAPRHGQPAPWDGVAAALLVAGSAFLVLRWLVSWWAGMGAGLGIALSAPFARAAQEDRTALPEGLVLLALAVVLAGWHNLSTRKSSAFRLADWLTWILVVIVGSSAAALSWLVQPRDALVISLIVFLGMGLGAVLAGRREASMRSWYRISAAAFSALAVPALGILTALLSAAHFVHDADPPDFELLLRRAVAVHSANFDTGFAISSVFLWLTIALVGWGTWRAVRRSFVDWRSQRMPTAWLLPLFAIVNLALLPQCTPERRPLPIVTSAVLLAVFGIADFLRGLGESLILTPPHERME